MFSFISLPIYFVRLDGKSEDFFSSPPKHPMQRRGEIDDKSALVDSINQTTITRSSRFPTAPANDRSPTKLTTNALAQKQNNPFQNARERNRETVVERDRFPPRRRKRGGIPRNPRFEIGLAILRIPDYLSRRILFSRVRPRWTRRDRHRLEATDKRRTRVTGTIT